MRRTVWIRLLLSLGLLVMVYRETGIWTTLTLGLVMFTFELQGAVE